MVICVGSKLAASTVSEKVSRRYSEVRLRVNLLSWGEVESGVYNETLFADLFGMGTTSLPFMSLIAVTSRVMYVFVGLVATRVRFLILLESSSERKMATLGPLVLLDVLDTREYREDAVVSSCSVTLSTWRVLTLTVSEKVRTSTPAPALRSRSNETS